ncbi:MAG: 3'(2'),5'-bisphosphate nucleotidase CysQ [Lysobacteraceae bacterium]
MANPQGEVLLDETIREGVIALAQAAAADILEVYDNVDDRAFEVETKADASPLTAADLASHRRIVAGLQRLTPDIPVLSEESAVLPIGERRAWTRLWLVDPLDGTREFIKRNGEFTVNIALIEDGVATFGVIQAPVQDTLWWGDRAHGAYVRRDGGEMALETRAPAIAPLRVAASRSHRDARTEAFMARMTADTGEIETIGVGSSLKFCRVAEGLIDLYPRFGPTSEWDTAAGQAIVEAAGGRVLDPQGRPFRYNQRDTLLNGDFIALGDARLPWASWCA